MCPEHGATIWEGVLVRKWPSSFSYVFLSLLTIVCLAPFSGRAVHVDDLLFVRAAQQIAQHPADPYGFQINWEFAEAPMFEITQNPPLASYYIALVARVAGWSERALHLGFILVAIALVLGTYRLAQKFTRSPLLASLCALLTPGVLVSATSLMCDTMMLAIWVWAAYFWIEGLDSGKSWLLSISALLTAASALTKYFGASLILLLLVYSVVRLRRIGTYLLYLIIPVVILLAYEFWSANLYGHGLLQGAAEFAQSQRDVRRGSLLGMSVVGLSYTGGCSLAGLSFAYFIWSRTRLIAGLVASAIAAIPVAAGWLDTTWLDMANIEAQAKPSLTWFGGFELALGIAAGIFLLALAIKDFWQLKDANSLFLGLWLLGTFFFATYVNWTVNARSVLPLIPAAGIMVARSFDACRSTAKRAFAIQVVVILLALSAFLSLWIAAGDSELANSERAAATLVRQKTLNQGSTVWFVGHWGFQYYMESLGVPALDLIHPQVHSGDFVVIPRNNSNVVPILAKFVASQEYLELPLKTWATTISPELGAGFYSSYWGPLPYAIGPVPVESYAIIRLGAVPEPEK